MKNLKKKELKNFVINLTNNDNKKIKTFLDDSVEDNTSIESKEDFKDKKQFDEFFNKKNLNNKNFQFFENSKLKENFETNFKLEFPKDLTNKLQDGDFKANLVFVNFSNLSKSENILEKEKRKNYFKDNKLIELGRYHDFGLNYYKFNYLMILILKIDTDKQENKNGKQKNIVNDKNKNNINEKINKNINNQNNINNQKINKDKDKEEDTNNQKNIEKIEKNNEKKIINEIKEKIINDKKNEKDNNIITKEKFRNNGININNQNIINESNNEVTNIKLYNPITNKVEKFINNYENILKEFSDEKFFENIKIFTHKHKKEYFHKYKNFIRLNSILKNSKKIQNIFVKTIVKKKEKKTSFNIFFKFFVNDYREVKFFINDIKLI